MVAFDSGVINLDSKTASSIFQKSSNKIYVRSMSNFIRWHRMQYTTRDNKFFAAFSYGFKTVWTILLHLGFSAVKFSAEPIRQFYWGLKDGMRFVQSPQYKSIPSYKIN